MWNSAWDFKQHGRQQAPGLYSKIQVRNGRADHFPLFIKITVTIYQPSVQEAGHKPHRHKSPSAHLQPTFYLCTKVTVTVLRVAAIFDETKLVPSPWNRLLQGFTGYLWINRHSAWDLLSKEGNGLQRWLWLPSGTIAVVQRRKCSDVMWFQRRMATKSKAICLNCCLRKGCETGWRRG